MKLKEMMLRARGQLADLADAREITSLLRIVFEDVFHWKSGDQDRDFSLVEKEKLEEIIRRLLLHEPIQYILGMADFYGYKFHVDPSVLIPRAETEELVYFIIQSLKERGLQSGRILDIGTGSGCIPITLKKELKGSWDIYGWEVSPTALEIAEVNARQLGTTIQWIQADILNDSIWPDLPPMDVIVSNPPYIPPSEQTRMDVSTIQFEPAIALYAPEKDPLIFYKAIAAYAKKNLSNGGQLFFELNDAFAGQTAACLREIGFKEVLIEKDMQGKNRMLRAALPQG